MSPQGFFLIKLNFNNVKNLVIQDYLNKNYQYLTLEEIYQINENDNGPVNNVIKKLAPHCFGLILKKDEHN